MNTPSVSEINLMVQNLRDQMRTLEMIENICNELTDQVNGLEAINDVMNGKESD